MELRVLQQTKENLELQRAQLATDQLQLHQQQQAFSQHHTSLSSSLLSDQLRDATRENEQLQRSEQNLQLALQRLTQQTAALEVELVWQENRGNHAQVLESSNEELKGQLELMTVENVWLRTEQLARPAVQEAQLEAECLRLSAANSLLHTQCDRLTA